MQARSEETHQRIMETAMRLFSTKGYDATGVAELCEGSDVSKGAFYHHFPSKQAVFIELLQQWLGGLDAELGRVAEAAADVPAALMGMAGQMKGLFSMADGRVQIFLEFWQQARRDPGVWKEFIAPYRRYQEYFAGLVARGVREGSLRDVDATSAGQALVALAVGIAVQGVLDPKAAAWDEVARDAVRLLIDGLRPGQGSARSPGR